MTEQQLQTRCFQWHWNTFPNERQMLFHVDNNSQSRIVGNQKKAQGVVKGVSDFILIVPTLVVFIELKTEDGSQTTAQMAFEKNVLKRGHIYKLVRSEQEFKDYIIRLYESLKDLL